MRRVTVTVLAADPISETGVTGTLHRRPEVRIVAADPVAGHEEIADVAVVVVDAVDALAVRLLASARHRGIRRTVLLAARVAEEHLAAAVEAGLDAGVVAVVHRSEATATRVATTVVQAAGAARIPAERLRGLMDGLDPRRRVPAVAGARPRSALVPREVDVLRLIAEGYDTAQIATTLCYSERTVKNVLHDVTSRLQLRNRSHAVAYAVREGLI